MGLESSRYLGRGAGAKGAARPPLAEAQKPSSGHGSAAPLDLRARMPPLVAACFASKRQSGQSAGPRHLRGLVERRSRARSFEKANLGR